MDAELSDERITEHGVPVASPERSTAVKATMPAFNAVKATLPAPTRLPPPPERRRSAPLC
ncbi:hypothetical protein [Prauserella flavalba]|uniref:hypothetical protein n=1 Tax=Prauserella flavalba TaxID=1477506 RepID=UPI0036ECE5EF